MDKSLCIRCDCHDPEHQFWLEYDSEEEIDHWDNIYLSIHLSKARFFKRLKYAFLYLFGYQSRYGAFSETHLSRDSVKEIEEFLCGYRNRKEVI